MSQASLVFVSRPAPAIQSNQAHPNSLSSGLVSPEADLCGESSRHHTLVLCPYELYVFEQLGLWHTVCKDTAKQGFKYNQMLHCPPRSVMLCVRCSADSRAVSGGGVCLFVCEGRSKRQNVFTNRF